MKSSEHPEYNQYLGDAALVVTCRAAVRGWIASGEALVGPGDVLWLPDTAREFIESVGRLFRQYNLVLWQTFDYCRRCCGGCCVPGASQVTVFDAIALALLAQPFPELPPHAAPGSCIYLGAQGCRWPHAWRPIKCWSFYCLGSGNWELDARDRRYAAITRALEAVVSEQLPHLLKGDAGSGSLALQEFLTDPISFAEALGAALYDIFVGPFVARYALADASDVASGAELAGDLPVEKALAFIASATERIWSGLEAAERDRDVQHLNDLERLEWIIVQKPRGAKEALHGLLRRYNQAARDGDWAAGDRVFAEQMAATVRELLQSAAF